MILADPNELFKDGILLVLAPHMDDELLACGGTIALLEDKDRIHVIYATDGSRSPVPIFPWLARTSPDLAQIRSDEAKAALNILNIPERNLHFLGFPDGNLKDYPDELCQSLVQQIAKINPKFIFVPFRYDRHPDHIALYSAIRKAVDSHCSEAIVFEYFVYYRYRLLPGGDIRKFIYPEFLFTVAIGESSDLKLRALNCYQSQTTKAYKWQDRPILTRERVHEVSHLPEVFLQYDPNFRGSKVFVRGGNWIRFVHHVEPVLKQKKEALLELLQFGKRLDGSEY
ncbi:MAG TPA: PIG-L deacetylase family protein [Anaerolineales bacterium]|nr:PIG-L deacetylase family protein [Anaerolineales bacterium]